MNIGVTSGKHNGGLPMELSHYNAFVGTVGFVAVLVGLFMYFRHRKTVYHRLKNEIRARAEEAVGLDRVQEEIRNAREKVEEVKAAAQEAQQVVETVRDQVQESAAQVKASVTQAKAAVKSVQSAVKKARGK